MKNNYLTKQQVQELITGLKIKESQADEFFRGLTTKGYTLEGYNDGSKGSINESLLSKVGNSVENIVEKRVGNIKQGLKEVPQAYNQETDSKVAGVVGAGLKVIQQPLNIAGQVAGAGLDILGKGIEKGVEAIPEGIKQDVGGDISKLVASPLGQKVKSDLSSDWEKLKSSPLGQAILGNPDLTRAIENTVNVASVVPIGQGVKTVATAGKDALGTVIKDTSAALSKIPRATDKLATIAKESINPTVSKEKAIGEVLQGTTKDIKKASEGLNLIDTTGIKTYKELDNTINNKISTLARTVDNEFAQDTTKTLLDNLTITKPTKAGGSVSVNYVDNALKQLEELYNKTGDIVSETDIRDLRNLAQTQGLTKLEINDIARTYGQEFGEKAFGKIGEPLTSVNAQLYENTRKGIKEVARNGLSSDAAKQADQAMSSLYNTRVLVKKNVEAVNKLMNRIEERGLLEKIGHSVSKYSDILTGGGLRGFVGGLLPRGAGYKTLNALDLESLLERNLKIIQDASKAKTGQEFKTITSQLLSPNNSLKNTANSLDKNISQVKTTGANIKNANTDKTIISDTIPQTKKNATKLSTSLKEKVTIPENSLISEAKKYKSADEFVKAQGTPIYHGGTKEIDKFDTTRLMEGNTGKGIYLTDTPESANYYGKLKQEREMLKRGDTTGEIPNAKITNIKINTNAQIKEFKKFPTGEEVKLAREKGFDGIKYPDEIIDNVEGIQGLKGNSRTIMMFNDSKIKTKSQLTDIWNKANK